MGMLSLIKAAPKAVVRTTGKMMFALKKTRPQIMVGGGIAIATGAFIIAIVNARKIDKTIAEGNQKIDELENKKNDIENAVNLNDDEKKAKLKELVKEINHEKARNLGKMFLLVGVPSIAFAGGICIIVAGHKLLFKWFGQVSAGFAALKETFDRYRMQNIEEHGEECDRRYMYGIVGEAKGTAKITDENGKEKTVKTKVPVVDPEMASGMYSFIFSQETSVKCPRDPVNTISFLRCQEKYWNVWMQGTGKPVTLSMVLDDLGIEIDPNDPKMDYILIAGWRPNGDGDNAINFGIMRAVNKKTLDMEDNTVMLNFNCDGNLYHSTRYDEFGKKVC